MQVHCNGEHAKQQTSQFLCSKRFLLGRLNCSSLSFIWFKRRICDTANISYHYQGFKTELFVIKQCKDMKDKIRNEQVPHLFPYFP